MRAPQVPITADTVTCQRCGAAFPITSLGQLPDHPNGVAGPAANPVAGCPYCGHAQALDAERVARLRRYAHDVDEQQCAAQNHASQVARWRNASDALSGRWTWWFFGMFGLCALLSGAAGLGLASVGWVSKAMVPAIALMGGFVLGTAGYVAAFVLRRTRSTPEPVESAGILVACPSCGAPGALSAGSSLDRCAHCAAPLIPSDSVIERGLDAATQARRRHAMQQYRAERSTVMNLYSRRASFAVAYLVIGQFALILLVAVAFFTWQAITGTGKSEPLGLALGWLTLLLTVGGLVGLIRYRRSRRARLDRALDELALEHSGRRLTSVTEMVEWLNHYWAGPFPVQNLYVGSQHGAAALRCGGYACLIDSNPTVSEEMVTRVQLLLAAEPPRALLGQPSLSIHPELAHLAAQGFAVRFEEAGLVVTASEAWIRQIRKRPEALHALAPIITSTARLSHALGAAPVASIP